MANVVPLVVSGEIQATQRAILMTIVNSTPYYLVTDVAGNPYFQPLYQDVSTGLDVFTQYATHVTVSLGARAGNTNSALITDLKVPGGGPFLANPLLLKVVAPGSITNAVAILPIEELSYANPSLVVSGYEYVLDGGYGFFITTNWSPTPNAQAISSLQQEPPATGFYVFPIDGLVNSKNQPASTSVFSAIYNDVLGQTGETFLFSSSAAWTIGAGEPFYYCANSACGPVCFGTCNGKYEGCQRLRDNNFACEIGVSTTCKIVASSPLWGVATICLILFAIVFFTNKYTHIHPTTGALALRTTHSTYAFTRRVKIQLCILIIIPAILLIIALALTVANTNGANWYLRLMCGNRDYP